MRFPSSAVPVGFGQAVAERRAQMGWSQARLARETGLSRETIARLETGRRTPTADSVFRLQSAMDMEPGELVPAWPEWNPIGLPTYGARTRQRRRELRLSLTTVAAAAGISVATLSRFEREQGHLHTTLQEAHAPTGAKAHLVERGLALALHFADAGCYRRYCLSALGRSGAGPVL
ncbi:helix-turn-helix domain-containing protein [Sphingomonadaceae bacterium OTU29LAMAA1]|nr:helix-turn-helix domain-containing protein [Sphingomonadaceae bacterium OTU29LAMAA1]